MNRMRLDDLYRIVVLKKSSFQPAIFKIFRREDLKMNQIDRLFLQPSKVLCWNIGKLLLE